MSLQWVTGAKGFIGQNLSRQLSTRGHLVVGLGRGQLTDHEIAANGLHGWLNSSITISSLELLRAQYGLPEVVFHLAGGSAVAPSLRAPHEDFERTVHSTSVLLEWLRLESPGTSVVYVSSAAVYGANYAALIAESNIPTPYSPYGFHKYCAELLIHEYACNYNLKASIVRLFSVFGPGLRKQLLWDVANRLRSQSARIELSGTGDELRDWLYIDDAVELLLQATTWVDSKVLTVNGGTGVGTSVRHTVEMLVAALGYESTLEFNGQIRVGDPRILIADTSRSDTLGFNSTVSLMLGIEKTAQWLKQELTK